MKNKRLKHFLLITILVAATGAAMAYSSNRNGLFSRNPTPVATPQPSGKNGIVSVSGILVQDKVLQGSAGTIGLNLTLKADEISAPGSDDTANVDLVIVMDRSGSMKGLKINNAREAVLKLLSSLGAEDRFALVTYSDDVQVNCDLLRVAPGNREKMAAAVNRVRVGGGTNLGAGLQTGINILRSSGRSLNTAKVILISDGLANKGITDVEALGDIAAAAVNNEFAVSTVGVGSDFNEYLMTAIADQGTGSYHYLENPAAFAEVFQKEFYETRQSVATNLKVQIPVNGDIRLIDAAGYPITHQNGYAVFYPGSLRSGQVRNLYLTLQVPTGSLRDFELKHIDVLYNRNGQAYAVGLADSFKIACVKDPAMVFSSIDASSWSDKVIREDFNRLKQEVAADIKAGRKQQAMSRISQYHSEQEAANAVIGSAQVAENLDKDLKELQTFVEDTFQGAPAAVRQKQNSNAKALQYEGYSGRRQQ
jgi:Ca-activated chloride channel family protein